MANPNLTITVEPFESGSVVYAPLAAGSANGQQTGQFSLRLLIANNEATSLVANKVALSFLPPPAVSPVTIPINVPLPPSQTTDWFFATADNLILPIPTPPAFTVGVWCNGFDAPAMATRSLAAHANPVANGAYLFPAKWDDLRQGEFWQGQSAVHSPGGGGWQLFPTT